MSLGVCPCNMTPIYITSVTMSQSAVIYLQVHLVALCPPYFSTTCFLQFLCILYSFMYSFFSLNKYNDRGLQCKPSLKK